jgi:hypothetical protein
MSPRFRPDRPGVGLGGLDVVLAGREPDLPGVQGALNVLQDAVVDAARVAHVDECAALVPKEGQA